MGSMEAVCLGGSVGATNRVWEGADSKRLKAETLTARHQGVGTFTLAYARARLPGHCGAADHL